MPMFIVSKIITVFTSPAARIKQKIHAAGRSTFLKIFNSSIFFMARTFLARRSHPLDPRIIFLMIITLFWVSGSVFAEDAAFEELRMRLNNFVQCEMTRTTATDYFGGKPFAITMINLFDSKREGGMLIVSGAVQCWIEDHHKTLHFALGVMELEGHDKVSYFVIRKKNFSILATELMRFPYKERCPWSQYWIDTD